VVQSCGLGTGMLATGLAMGVEPQMGIGASALPNAPAHHRVCSCHPGAERTGCHAPDRIGFCLWIWPTRHGHVLENRSLHWSRFSTPARWNAALSSRQHAHAPERRQEADGSLRLVYAASLRRCRPCELREQCQWNGSATKKPRQVSVLLHPLSVGSEPFLWYDWSRRVHRHACIHLLRSQRIEVHVQPPGSDVATSPVTPALLSRAERAHTRLSWDQRLVRNARAPSEVKLTITLFGVPDAFAALLGLRAS